MSLEFWVPVTIGIGLVVFALMFAFVVACDKV
ncbi:hypothetical protein VT84_27210 [Gemmata sp. SH-PL17]|uniref:Uncharacterized protein n=1 Tax=Gemmata massiliana TaxID=1210884 RepID=A0A6P2DCJ7_9BACT|nr:hypothetical protein VT84_27210 [Gemmata sp. SH-PL17]VTR98458.1 unnamed protein product [Gemmata massiliana]